MAKRRPSGDGMVRKREDGRWEGRIVVGHKENGDSIFRYIYAPTQKELTTRLRQEAEVYQGIDLTEQSKMMLAEWLDQWLEMMAPAVRPSTLRGYRHYAERIKETLGRKQLTKITPTEIQAMYDHLQNHGRVNEHPQYGRALSGTTVASIHTMLYSVMKAAEQARLIPRNPVVEVSPPKREQKPKQILTDEQLEIFMDTIDQDAAWRDFFYTELTTGLRRGEICGLKWEDFDEASNTLKVCRTLQREKGGRLTTGDTKTYAGTRKIVLPPSTAQRLRERKTSALTEWIFPHPLHPEQPINPNRAYTRMKELLKQAGLPSIPFHSMRHTFATHALASGVDAKTLSGILGHTKASFTLDTYTHVTGDMQRKAAEVVNDFLTELLGEELIPCRSAENAVTEASI